MEHMLNEMIGESLERARKHDVKTRDAVEVVFKEELARRANDG